MSSIHFGAHEKRFPASDERGVGGMSPSDYINRLLASGGVQDASAADTFSVLSRPVAPGGCDAPGPQQASVPTGKPDNDTMAFLKRKWVRYTALAAGVVFALGKLLR